MAAKLSMNMMRNSEAPYPDIQVVMKSLHTIIPMIEPRTAIRMATLHRMNTMTKVM